MNVCNVLVSMPRAAKLTEGAVDSAFTRNGRRCGNSSGAKVGQ